MSANGNIKKTKDLLTEEQQDVLRNKGNKIDKLQADITSLSKPLLQSEDSQGWAQYVTPNTMSVFQDEKSWIGINSIEQKKKKQVKEFQDANGLSWSNMRDSMHLESDDDNQSSDGSPTTTRLDAKDMSIFGSMPLEDDIVVVKCKNCQRPLLPSKFKEHSESCIGQAVDDDEDDEKMVKKKKKAASLEDDLNTPTTTAKRPPSAALEKAEKKKIKKEKQKKPPKQKAPLDLDKQCGVIGGPNNQPCTRSLTCKTHSMGAKRSVEGRSQPYDVLLAAYQKKSIGRPNGKDQPKAPGTTDSEGMVSGKSLKGLKKLQQSQFENGSGTNGSVNEEQFIDSDEEVENVMQALRSSRPTPLAQKPYYFVKRRRQCFRLRDILLNAITPKSNTMNHQPQQPFYHPQQQQQQPQQQQQSQNIYNNPNDPTMYSMNPSFSVR